MKFAQSAILISLLTVFFLGNIGVNVFKHICEEDGVSVSYLFNQGEEHCDEHAHKNDLPPCCQASDDQEEDDCCDDEVYYYKLQVDAELQADYSFHLAAITAEVPEIYGEERPVTSERTTHCTFEDPPPLSGRDILRLKQVWNL
jgi:hypothetical protein